MTTDHDHPKTDELAVFWVPADTDQKCELKVVEHDFRAIGELVGGYIAPMPHRLPHLACGCGVQMLCDEEGLLKGAPHNLRASTVGTEGPHGVVGDVVFVGAGWVRGSAGLDWFSLPQAFTQWEGPGAPYPDQRQPWEQ